MLSYIETDYFGGVGTQSAIVYENGIAKNPLKTENQWNTEKQCYFQIPESIWAINTIWKKMGVICQTQKDEFDSIRLGFYRHTEDSTPLIPLN